MAQKMDGDDDNGDGTGVGAYSDVEVPETCDGPGFNVSTHVLVRITDRNN